MSCTLPDADLILATSSTRTFDAMSTAARTVPTDSPVASIRAGMRAVRADSKRVPAGPYVPFAYTLENSQDLTYRQRMPT